MGKVKFFRATEALYNSIGSPDKDAVYFITDKKRIYVDGICYSSSSSNLGDLTHPNYIDVKADLNGYLIVPSDTIPVAVLIEGKAYDINNCVIIKEGQNYKLDSSHFLTKANLASYTGFYRIWRAGGKPGLDGAPGKDGNDGAPGEQGVGITNILLDFSLQDGDINQITIYTSDGSFYTIHTRNGSKGTDGTDGSDGAPGKDGTDGKDGTNGITPHIGDNGNWFIGDTDTGVKANAIEERYIETQDQNGYIIIPSTRVPSAIAILNKIYSILEPMLLDGDNIKISVAPYLAKHNVQSYSGIYKVWLS